MSILIERYKKKQKDLTKIGIAPPFPKIIKIDICNRCNFSCIFCPQSTQVNKKGNIDDILCEKVIKDAFNAGAREICFSSTGEPLLNTNLLKYIKLSKNLGYTYLFLNTNGYLMTEEKAHEILLAGIDSVKFSINGAYKTYELIHGIDAYERIVKNLKNFDYIRKQQKSKCKLYVSYVATKYSSDDFRQVKKDVSDYIDDIMFMKANNRGGIVGSIDEEICVEEDEYSYHFPCSQLFNNIYVTSEGYVVACCQDFENNLVMADLHDMNIEEAWNCDSFTTFRKMFLNKEFSGYLCDNCLNNTHNTIIPFQYEYAGYDHSKQKYEEIKDRINKLKTI